MDYRYANRGKSLEELIDHANGFYRSRGLGLMVKVPTEFIPLRDRQGRVHGVKVTHKATVDFIGRWQGMPLAVEAKSTSTGTIRLDAVQDNQATDLDAWTAATGAAGLVVVSFGYERFFSVPWQFWCEAYDLRCRQRRRDATLWVRYGGLDWKVPPKMSLTADDMAPEWEVFMAAWGLDYMGVMR